MTRTRCRALGIALLLVAAPAAATIEVFEGAADPSAGEALVFQPSEPMASTVFAFGEATGTGVTFLGRESLLTFAAPERLATGDGGMDAVTFFLSDALLAFTTVEFNIVGTAGGATSVALSFADQFGNAFDNDFALVEGNNFFSARAIDDQFIFTVSVLAAGDFGDIRDFRIGGIAAVGEGTVDGIPEPASWALMIAGFALVGGARRRVRALQRV